MEQEHGTTGGAELHALNNALRALFGNGVEEAPSVDAAMERIAQAGVVRHRHVAAGHETIRSFAEEQLKTTRMPYSSVLARVKERFPECRTSRSSLRWYASQMRKRGETLPDRPVDVPQQ